MNIYIIYVCVRAGGMHMFVEINICDHVGHVGVCACVRTVGTGVYVYTVDTARGRVDRDCIKLNDYFNVYENILFS